MSISKLWTSLRFTSIGSHWLASFLSDLCMEEPSAKQYTVLLVRQHTSLTFESERPPWEDAGQEMLWNTGNDPLYFLHPFKRHILNSPVETLQLNHTKSILTIYEALRWPTQDSDPNHLFDSGQFVLAAAPVLAHIAPTEIECKLVAFKRPLHVACIDCNGLRRKIWNFGISKLVRLN